MLRGGGPTELVCVAGVWIFFPVESFGFLNADAEFNLEVEVADVAPDGVCRRSKYGVSVLMML